MTDNMYDLTGWQRVSCYVADVMRVSGQLRPFSSLTDPDGQYGHPVIYIEWGIQPQGVPLLREYQWPADPSRECEHFVPVDDRAGVVGEVSS
jgi:hypothetical protein